MRLSITHDLARGLWLYLADCYGTHLLHRGCDEVAHDVGLILDAMGIRKHREFLRHHTLTMVDTIYTPFVPGEVSAAWYPVDQVAAAIHEHHHVIQAEVRGAMSFVGGYLVRPDHRATYEAEAFRTNMELAFWLTGDLPDVDELAKSARAYACGRDQVQAIRNYLTIAASAVEAGEVQSEVVRVATQWLAENERRPDG